MYMRDEVTREWKKVYNEEINDLYFSSNIVRVIKSRRMRWTGHVARMEDRRGIWWGNLRDRDNLGDPGVDGRMILRWIFREWDGSVDWVELDQDRYRWRALVNAVMNVWVPYSEGNFLTTTG